MTSRPFADRLFPAWLELAGILAWAAFVGRNYLSLDPRMLPAGYFNEFGSAIMSHAVWTNARACGLCVLWNGAINGGNPAFAELHGAPLHPLVVASTLVWDTVVGAKMVVVASMALAGVAQWWLAWVLGLGRLPRLWGALMAVTGSHLLARLDQGVVAVVLSTAACSLVLVPLLETLLRGGRRPAVLLGVMLALALTAGQGYLQLGVALGLGPAVAVMLLWPGRRRPWRELALALGLALLLAGVFVVPLAHFWTQFSKDSDPGFASVQPLHYLLLGFVLDDVVSYRAGLLGNQPFPYLYINYLGWIPVLFSLLGVLLARRADRPGIVFLLLALGGVLLAAGAVPFRALALLAPGLATMVRNPSLIAGLATPLLLALAAYGVERLLRLGRSHTIRVLRPGAPLLQLLLALPLLWSLAAVYGFNRQWLATAQSEPGMQRVFEVLRTSRARWVALPYGQHSWVAPALDAGLKLTDVVRPWRWAERSTPPPARRTTTELQPGYQARIGELYVVAEPAPNYAAVRSQAQTAVCIAHARGGNIDVECSTAEPGVLELQEHGWSGWQATRDGVAVPLEPGEWLRVAAPAGTHSYSFRYRPWDVALGALLSVVGVLLALRLWHRPGAAHSGEGRHFRCRLRVDTDACAENMPGTQELTGRL